MSIPGDLTRTFAVGLARELYDRFVMGGWEPKDTYEIIEDVLTAHAAVQRIQATADTPNTKTAPDCPEAA